MKIVLATRNPGKVRELRHLLGGLPLVELPPEAPDVAETGQSYEENALLKARSAARATGLPAIADDSGLEVDALDGAPGLVSARFAQLRGAGGGVADNRRLLLELLAEVPPARRTARFRCVAAFVAGDVVLVGRGVCEGLILDEARGEHGFGYDPLFYCPELGATFGEATLEAAARVSHRGRAAADLRGQLEKGPRGW